MKKGAVGAHCAQSARSQPQALAPSFRLVFMSWFMTPRPEDQAVLHQLKEVILSGHHAA